MIKFGDEDIKKSIEERLSELFPKVAVYKEAITNPMYPHFFVYVINVVDIQDRRDFHNIEYSIDIRYRIADDSSEVLKLQTRLDEIILILMNGFNMIPFYVNEKGKTIYAHCKDKSFEKEDGVLHFMFNITTMVKDVVAKNKAKQMSLTSSVNLTEE